MASKYDTSLESTFYITKRVEPFQVGEKKCEKEGMNRSYVHTLLNLDRLYESVTKPKFG